VITARPQLAVLCDLLEENWPSMDLVAEELVRALRTHCAAEIEARAVRPALARRMTRVPGRPLRRGARHADIFLTRFWDYPRALRHERADLYHVSDHSYAHLVRWLPEARTGVYCHDLDAFRCLLEPSRDPRPLWFRTMMRTVLDGMRRAAVVFYSTDHVRRGIERAGLIDSKRLVHAPYGTAAEFVAEPGQSDLHQQEQLGLESGSYAMHVGSCIPRKRIDILLAAVHAAKKHAPELRLLQVGGTWTDEQALQLRKLGLEKHVVQVRGIDRSLLAALYRGAAIVLHTSEAEGFGLPVIEALACGTAVAASDIPAIREVGGEAVTYVRVGDIDAFASALGAALARGPNVPSRSARLSQAARFSWASHGRTILESYQRLLAR